MEGLKSMSRWVCPMLVAIGLSMHSQNTRVQASYSATTGVTDNTAIKVEKISGQSGAVPPGARQSASPANEPLKVTPVLSGTSLGSTPEQVEQYLAPANTTVRQALSQWALKNHWQVIWKLSTDYAIPAAVSYSSKTLIEATGRLLADLRQQGVFLAATFYRGNNTVVVSE